MSPVKSNVFLIFFILICMLLIPHSCLIALTRYFSVPRLFLFFYFSGQKAGTFVTLLCWGTSPLPILSQTVGRLKELRTGFGTGFGPTLLEPQLHCMKGKVPLLQSFISCGLPLVTRALLLRYCLEAMVGWRREREKRWDISVLSECQVVPLLFCSQNQRAGPEASLLTSKFLVHLSSGQKVPEGRKM